MKQTYKIFPAKPSVGESNQWWAECRSQGVAMIRGWHTSAMSTIEFDLISMAKDLANTPPVNVWASENFDREIESIAEYVMTLSPKAEVICCTLFKLPKQHLESVIERITAAIQKEIDADTITVESMKYDRKTKIVEKLLYKLSEL